MKMFTTTLKNLPETLVSLKWKDFAENIVRYQYFRTSVALKLFEYDFSSKITATNYFNLGIAYLKGTRNIKGMPNSLATALDSVNKAEIEIVEPTQVQRRRDKKVKYEKISVPVVPKKVIETDFQYGVLYDNKIFIQKNLDCANSFIDGVRFLKSGDIDAKVITFSYDEV